MKNKKYHQSILRFYISGSSDICFQEQKEGILHDVSPFSKVTKVTGSYQTNSKIPTKKTAVGASLILTLKRRNEALMLSE